MPSIYKLQEKESRRDLLLETKRKQMHIKIPEMIWIKRLNKKIQRFVSLMAQFRFANNSKPSRYTHGYNQHEKNTHARSRIREHLEEQINYTCLNFLSKAELIDRDHGTHAWLLARHPQHPNTP
ncbi:hypothetical protein ABZP36_012005 [Zizania latifolia]